jgi:hypothetical protein
LNGPVHLALTRHIYPASIQGIKEGINMVANIDWQKTMNDTLLGLAKVTAERVENIENSMVTKADLDQVQHHLDGRFDEIKQLLINLGLKG